jgi:hypothetical protein
MGPSSPPRANQDTCIVAEAELSMHTGHGWCGIGAGKANQGMGANDKRDSSMGGKHGSSNANEQQRRPTHELHQASKPRSPDLGLELPHEGWRPHVPVPHMAARAAATVSWEAEVLVAGGVDHYYINFKGGGQKRLMEAGGPTASN